MKGGIAHAGAHDLGRECDPDNYDEGVDQDSIAAVSKRLVKRMPSLKGAYVKKGFSGLL